MSNEPIDERELDRAMRVFDEFEHPRPDEVLLRKVRSAVRAELSARRVSWRVYVTPVAAAMAACLVATVVMWTALRSGNASDTGSGSAPQYAQATETDDTPTMDTKLAALGDELDQRDPLGQGLSDESDLTYASLSAELETIAGDLAM